MSKNLGDSAESQFNKTLSLFQKGKLIESLEELEKAEEAAKLLLKDPESKFFEKNLQTKFFNVFNLGYLLVNLGRFYHAQYFYELSLLISKKLLQTDPDNVSYQSYVGMTLNNLGNLLKNMGRIEEAKMRYEKALEIYEKLLQTDPDNVSYQSYVGGTLNNLGSLLSDMGRIEEAKQKYKRALEIFTEPMQYLTIGRKSNSIIKLIELNTEQAGKENDPFNQMGYLREIFKLYRDNQEFLTKYELKNERKLVVEAGLSAYIEYLKKNIRLEPDLKKRVEKYEKALQSVEKLSVIENDETISKIYSSAACFLRGRKLVNEALASRKPEFEFLRQAVEQFKSAKEIYDEANDCFCIHT